MNNWKQFLFLHQKLVTFFTVFGLLAIYLSIAILRPGNLLWFKKIQDYSPVSVTDINQNIESQQNILPAYVLSGYVVIDNPKDLKSYRFGKKGDSGKPLLTDETKASGVYVRHGSFVRRITDIQELKNDDFIYVTFYQNPAWSDSGKRGQTILGIMDKIQRDGDSIVFSFLDDPDQRQYNLMRSVSLETEVKNGLYDFSGEPFDGVKNGTTLQAIVDDKWNLISATIKEPNFNVAFGRLINIIPSPQKELEISLEGNPKPFLITESTKIVKRGQPDILFTPDKLIVGQIIHIVYFNRGDYYVGLSLDYQE